MASDDLHMKYSDLIIDYLDGNVSASEKADVEAWITKSDENKAFFEKLKKAWNNEVPQADLDQALNKFYQRVENKEQSVAAEPKVIPLQKKSRSFSLRVVSQIAAALVIGLGVGYFSNSSDVEISNSTAGTNIESPLTAYDPVVAMKEIATNNEELKQKTFNDGSSIHLKKNSSVSYPETFDKNVRSITLNKGSVFCEVEHKANDAVFLVKAGKTTVQVVGTKFLVEKISDDDVSVYVEEGLVIVYKDNDQIKQVLVRKGEKAVSKTENERVKILSSFDPNITSWHSKKLNFQRMKMSDVVLLMNEVYGKELIIKDEEVKNYELTAQFDGATADEMLFYIEEIFNLEIIKQDGDAFHIFSGKLK